MEKIRTITFEGRTERIARVGPQWHLPPKERLINTPWCQYDKDADPWYALPNLMLFNSGKGMAGPAGLEALIKREMKQGIIRPEEEVREAFKALGVEMPSKLFKAPGKVKAPVKSHRKELETAMNLMRELLHALDQGDWELQADVMRMGYQFLGEAC